VGDRAGRDRQIGLIAQLAHSLDRLTHSPLIGMALSTMRKPARLAGLGELQVFLERGYKAFRKMKGADAFIQIVTTRERKLMEALFAGNDAVLYAACLRPLIHAAPQSLRNAASRRRSAGV
jgi:hypothetical protein